MAAEHIEKHQYFNILGQSRWFNGSEELDGLAVGVTPEQADPHVGHPYLGDHRLAQFGGEHGAHHPVDTDPLAFAQAECGHSPRQAAIARLGWVMMFSAVIPPMNPPGDDTISMSSMCSTNVGIGRVPIPVHNAIDHGLAYCGHRQSLPT